MVGGRNYLFLILVSDVLLCTGFDLSAMGEEVYLDAVVDVVGPESLVSDPCAIKVCGHFVSTTSFSQFAVVHRMYTSVMSNPDNSTSSPPSLSPPRLTGAQKSTP